MNYTVNVPIGRGLAFPNRCPFSDLPSPTGTVRLKQTSTSFVIPLPGGFLNSYSRTTFNVPAARKVVALALTLEIMIWVSILGGMFIAGLVGTSSSHYAAIAVLFLPAGLIAALGFRVARAIVLRPVRIRPPWNDFVEVRFASESYAKEFCELNRLPLAS